MHTTRNRLFGLVMFWTIATTVFAWLPLARIIGKPEGYTWGVLGLSGSGTEGPFWIFILLTAYAVALLFSAYRAPRRVLYPLLLLWHLAFTTVIFTGVLSGGADATMQGQGLHWEFPLWLVGVPCVIFTAVVVAWVVIDYRSGGAPPPARWAPGNTRRLLASLALLGAGLVCFRAGTNYDWVTAAAIVLTISHWILLAVAFEPRVTGSAGIQQGEGAA